MTAPAAAATDSRVEHEQVAAMFATLPGAAAADVLLAITTAGSFYYLGSSGPAVLAWLALHVLQKLRYPRVAAYFRDPRASERSRHWATLATRDIFVSSTVWALAPWFLLSGHDLPREALLMVIVLTLASGGMLSLSSVRGAIFAHAVPMTTGLALAMVWRGRGVEFVLAACCVMYLFFTLRFALRQHRLLTEALVARFAKEDLADELARQMEIARLASEEKTRFFASASHDLRQPLHAIALFGAVLEKELRDSPQHEHAVRQMKAVRALEDSLGTMLDVSQLDAGVVVPEPRDVAVNDVLQSLQTVFAPRAEQKGLHLRLRASRLRLRTDPLLLTRLLSNIVDNAIKYTPAGGVLVVTRARPGCAWIECHDSGIGLEPDQVPRIFDEFYQVDNAGRDRSLGLGIGLAIVRRLARLLGHEISVKSRPGRGTRFRVVVPLADAAEASAATRLSAVPETTLEPARPERVLVVDDETEVGQAVAALLASHRIEATVVQGETEAQTALAVARRSGRPFGMLLCDYRLAHGADGLEAALRLREQEGGRLSVIMVTGETAPERLQRVRASGLPVLFKPAGAEALLRAMSAAASTAD